jgi:hypothetical protein
MQTNHFILLIMAIFFCGGCLYKKESLYGYSDPKVTILKDKIEFQYLNLRSIKYSLDTFKGIPPKIKLYIPKNLKNWEINNGSRFIFYYPNHEFVFVKTRLLAWNPVLSDTIFAPSKDYIENIIAEEVIAGRGKHRLKEAKYISWRKSLVIQKNGVLILLYNIRNKKLMHYKNLAERVTLL